MPIDPRIKSAVCAANPLHSAIEYRTPVGFQDESNNAHLDIEDDNESADAKAARPGVPFYVAAAEHRATLPA